MKALRFSRFGSPSVLEVVHRADGPPEPQADEVVVEVQAASINPSDIKNVAGKMHRTTLPRTPGRDFAGIVVEGPSELLGLEVWGAGGDLGFSRDGTHAEYVVIPSSAVCRKPRNLHFVEAAAVGVAYVTAFHGLIDTLKLSAGESVLVTGTSGSVGMAVVQIAKWMGVQTIGLDRTNHEHLPEQLRPHVPLLLKDDVAQRVHQATEGRGVHCVFDTVGSPVFSTCLATLRDDGRYLIASNAGGDSHISLEVIDFYRRRLTLMGIDTLNLSSVDGAKILDHLRAGFESGHLLPPMIARTVELEEATTAYSLQGWSGKTVITMNGEIAQPAKSPLISAT